MSVRAEKMKLARALLTGAGGKIVAREKGAASTAAYVAEVTSELYERLTEDEAEDDDRDDRDDHDLWYPATSLSRPNDLEYVLAEVKPSEPGSRRPEYEVVCFLPDRGYVTSFGVLCTVVRWRRIPR
jgi:hypothetical protein